MRRLLPIASVTAIAIVLGVVWYLNRTTCDESEYWGEVCYGFRWGKAVQMTVDRNRDGVPEVQARYRGGLGHDPRYTHAKPEESWEDWDGDGRFDHHYGYGDDGLDLLQIDTTGDGTFDLRLSGDDAREYLADNPWPGV